MLSLKRAFVGACTLFLAGCSSIGLTSFLGEPESSRTNVEKNDTIRKACPQLDSVRLTTVTTNNTQIPQGQNTINIPRNIASKGLKPGETLADVIEHVIKIVNAKAGSRFKFNIDSYGGEIDVARQYVYAMQQRPDVTFETMVSGYGFSAAAAILVSGTRGHRTALSPAEILLHPVRIHAKTKEGKDLTLFEEDLPVDSTHRITLRADNNWLRNLYQKASVTDITTDCVNALIHKKDDNLLSPQAALRLGLIDTVQIVDAEGKLTNNFIMRTDDPRAKPVPVIIDLGKGKTKPSQPAQPR